jgi:hypothetical protein
VTQAIIIFFIVFYAVVFIWALYLYRLWPDVPKTRHQWTVENIERLEKENAAWDRHLRKLMK